MESISVDALPYIDKEYDDPSMKSIVDKLIEDEMKNNTINPALNTHPKASVFKSNKLLRGEYERVKNKIKMESFDTTRYKLEQPSSKASVQEWTEAVNNAQAQLEHQLIRIENLELLDTYGSNSWILYNSYLEKLLDARSEILKQTKQQITDVNKARKYEQVEASVKLASLENLYAERIYNIAQLRYAISYLESLHK
ncbi:Pre-mRNA-splicing factor SPF27 [Smittium culicis]|uniref:Pre-mRNA-splicing factor SPF27 n=1 Tax=Smittium culicis TaxID=133412 RepID=A0A1R1YA39_9FUNG|nr:Pre-mRNA-splicing factor SPF27 [Smittium culicis]OMJ23753.1 Pre-mRNA-splicing factor SPF27 [Smittium culicis]